MGVNRTIARAINPCLSGRPSARCGVGAQFSRNFATLRNITRALLTHSPIGLILGSQYDG